jgi:protein involved in polysaccharide export with SLBB domain
LAFTLAVALAASTGSAGAQSGDTSLNDPSAPSSQQQLQQGSNNQGSNNQGGNNQGGTTGQGNDNGPVRLRSDDSRGNQGNASDDRRGNQNSTNNRTPVPALPPKPSEFESFVLDLTGVGVRAFGRDLANVVGQNDVDYSSQVPPDYIVSVGDEIALSIWGSVDANLRVTVDRGGRITIPRVGTMLVAGIRYDELTQAIKAQVGRIFHNFEVSASLGRLRGVRVFVTGFVERPGAYTVSSLSTISGAILRAGGTGAAGSLRDIRLIRKGKEIAHVDLYKVLLKGDRAGDVAVLADDVIQVAAIGPQIAIVGSVNSPAAFEIVPDDTVADVLQMAGGFNSVADRSRLVIEALSDRATSGVKELALPADLSAKPSAGDVYRAMSAVALRMPILRQNKHVSIEGEVRHPGEYLLPPNATTEDAIAAAGGLTPLAYVYGMELDRESTRRQQALNYDRALRDLETQFTLSATTQRATTADEAAGRSQATASVNALFMRLKEIKPSGRIVLQLPPDTTVVPRLALENSDHIIIPPVPTTVGVFGSVFNGGSFLYQPNRELQYYLNLAGGPTPGANAKGAFVIRPNGSVVSIQQSAHWFNSTSAFERVEAHAGDTIFVPEELDKSTFVQSLKDWTQILYQSALGFAALKTIK